MADDVKPKRRFDSRDWDTIAEYVLDEKSQRATRRTDLERQWDEIDRQVKMEPDTSYKKTKEGKDIPGRTWMAEMELPLQAQCLEVLTADARRFMFPDNGQFFSAHAIMTDEYLSKVDFKSHIVGDENEVPSVIDQDNTDKIVEGFLRDIHSRYDLPGVYDVINAEAFSYGVGVGRCRQATKQVFIQTANGTVKESKTFPVLVPRSIRRTYLDDNDYAVMNEGYVLGGAVIYHEVKRLEDIVVAATKGSNDPMDPNGGWMPSNLSKLKVPDGTKSVDILEYEGDLVVPRKTVSSMYIPGAIVTVVATGGSRAVIRFRYRKYPWSSYLLHPYHVERVGNPYGTSPLMKGRPVQIAATNALNRILDAAMLSVAPPVGYDRDDSFFAQEGGPKIEPFAIWGTNGDVKIHQIGQVAPLVQAYIGILQQYENLTGITAPRLGAQTVSHTTAYAKNVEVDRGTVRTVDYVKSSGVSPIARFLGMEYQMARDSFSGSLDVYLPTYRGWVRVTKDLLPEQSAFEWLGAAGPQEEQARQQARIASAQMALQIDTLNIQLGGKPALDRPKLIQEVLREGGWIDVDSIAPSAGTAEGGEAAPGVPGAVGGNAGSPAAALQALAFSSNGAGPQ